MRPYQSFEIPESLHTRFNDVLVQVKPRLKGKTIVAAVSGGADSLCLLGLLWSAAGNLGFKLRAVHVNHGLRGGESDKDEALVQKVCAGLKVPLAVYAGFGRGDSEDGWRKIRRGCYEKACQRYKATIVTLAHHQDDQAETILFNLARGTGIQGASGLKAVSSLKRGGKILLLRPLLGFTGPSLKQALRSAGWPWREDKSNQNTKHSRNLLRQRILPLLEKAHPGASGNLAGFGARALDLSDWADEMADDGLKSASLPSIHTYDLAKLKSLHPYVRGLALRMAASRLPGLKQGIDQKATGRLAGLVSKGTGACDLLKGYKATARKGVLIMGKTGIRACGAFVDKG